MLPRIEIYVLPQVLKFYPPNANHPSHTYVISTAKKGVGELIGSYQTPRGQLRVCAKFGGGLPLNTVFRSRVPTGEFYSPSLAAQFPERDWILSRILWLEGTQEGINKGREVDTKSRYIYLHGTPEENSMGSPLSHGCIRMRNADIGALYPKVPVGTAVLVIP